MNVPTEEEVKNILNMLKNGKAMELEEIRPEVLKKMRGESGRY